MLVTILIVVIKITHMNNLGGFLAHGFTSFIPPSLGPILQNIPVVGACAGGGSSSHTDRKQRGAHRKRKRQEPAQGHTSMHCILQPDPSPAFHIFHITDPSVDQFLAYTRALMICSLWKGTHRYIQSLADSLDVS